MKNRIMMTLMAGILAVSMAACGSTKESESGSTAGETAAVTESTEEGTTSGTTEGAQIPNPFVDYDTLEDAEKAAGFDFAVPDTVDGKQMNGVQVMSGSMIQVIYGDADTENTTLLRKEKDDGSTDESIGISGDYTDYTEVRTVTVGDRTVTVKGADGKISVAIWNSDGYQYAADFGDAVDEETAETVIGQMQ